MELVSTLTSHVTSTPKACGFIVGFVDAGTVVPLGAVRCVHLAEGGLLPVPLWDREAAEVAASVPVGLCVVGWYAACTPAELTELVTKDAPKLRAALAPAARDKCVLAAVPKGGEAPPSFFTASVPSAAGKAVALEDMAAAEGSVHSLLAQRMVVLRAAPLVHLHVEGGAGGAWAAAHAAASDCLLYTSPSPRDS